MKKEECAMKNVLMYSYCKGLSDVSVLDAGTRAARLAGSDADDPALCSPTPYIHACAAYAQGRL